VNPTRAACVLTRRCNLSCGYCAVVRQPLPRELDGPEWQQALSILDSLGVETLSFTGGEPTILPFLLDLLHYVRDKTRMACMLATNCTFPVEQASAYAHAGIRALIISIDTIGGEAFDDSSLHKSQAALQNLNAYRAAGIPRFIANVLIHRGNLARITDTVLRLADLGVAAHPLVLHAGAEPFWQNRGKDLGLALRPEDRPLLEEVAGELQELKRAGLPMDCNEAFLTALPRYAIGLDWHCHPNPRKLRVDADGTLSVCQDIRGAVTSSYHIFDLQDPERCERFLQAWGDDSRACPGCFYTDIFHAHPESGSD
jgi:MoaA/NifB/PqqE/SkfB family radical SAM enzyme